MMEEITKELESMIREFAPKFALIPKEEFCAKLLPDKWSKQEVIGHLIDSAHNNLRRFIVGQYDQHNKIVYDQEFWNIANGYQSMKQGEVITLWVMLNRQIITVLQNMPEEKYNNLIDTGKDEISEKSLIWLAEDYVKHMKHHFNQVFPASFDIVYV